MGPSGPASACDAEYKTWIECEYEGVALNDLGLTCDFSCTPPDPTPRPVPAPTPGTTPPDPAPRPVSAPTPGTDADGNEDPALGSDAAAAQGRLVVATAFLAAGATALAL